MSYTYDEIYGIDLDAYCAAHNTTIEELVKKIDIDIELLTIRLKELLDVDFMEQDNAQLNYVHSLIRKKNTHKDRLYEWLAEGKKPKDFIIK